MNIEDFACYTEMERVYPAGATFKVLKRSYKNGTPTIRLKLIGDDDECEIITFERIRHHINEH